jgi:magnesium transporter
MSKKKRVHKTGRPPGWLQYTGSKQDGAVEIWRYVISSEQVQRQSILKEAFSIDPPVQGRVVWMECRGLHEVDLIEKTGGALDMSRLVMEDMLNVHHPPKLETGESFLFLSLRYPIRFPSLETEVVNLILAEGRVFSFADHPSDPFEPVWQRLEDPSNRLRSLGADHLFMRLIDLVCDQYLPLLNEMREQYDAIQERLIKGEEGGIMQEVMQLRSALIEMRQYLLPLRTALLDLNAEAHPLINKSVRPYLLDILEHLQQAVEEQRGLADGIAVLLELHHANISNKMNSVMKTLTVVASIFIPLTFLAGIYGMNFTYMPELSKPWAYPALLLLMLFIAGGMIWYMRRKKWL